MAGLHVAGVQRLKRPKFGSELSPNQFSIQCVNLEQANYSGVRKEIIIEVIVVMTNIC